MYVECGLAKNFQKSQNSRKMEIFGTAAKNVNQDVKI